MDVLAAVEALGALATALSLVYLAKQTRAARTEADLAIRVSLLNAHDALTDRAMSINQLFIERPHLRPYFYANAALDEEAAPELGQQVEAVAEHLADFIENALLHQQTLGSDAIEVWENYCTALVARSPTLRSFLTANSDWYDAGVRRVLEVGSAQSDD